MTNYQIVQSLSKQGVQTSKSSIRRFLANHPEIERSSSTGSNSAAKARGEAPGAEVRKDTATIVGSTTEFLTPEELMLKAMMIPSEWDYEPILNQWDGPGQDGSVRTFSQLKLVCKRKVDLSLLNIGIKPSWVPPKPRKRKKTAGPQYTVVLPDPHAPLHEERLIEASVSLIDELKPSRVICLGDAGDNSPFGRHRPNLRPDLDISVDEAILGSYELLARWRNAAPDADMELCPGNHDHWLQCRVLELLPNAMKVKRPGETFPLLSLRSILALDSLNITINESGGEYHDSVLNIAEDLIGLHGTLCGKTGGAVKEQTRWEGSSIVQGHDHKTSFTAITKRLPGGGESQRYAMSAGTMARRDLGYNPAHDCNQSFMVFTVWPDGRWHPDFALYDPITGETTWRDWRYK